MSDLSCEDVMPSDEQVARERAVWALFKAVRQQRREGWLTKLFRVLRVSAVRVPAVAGS